VDENYQLFDGNWMFIEEMLALKLCFVRFSDVALRQHYYYILLPAGFGDQLTCARANWHLCPYRNMEAEESFKNYVKLVEKPSYSECDF